MKTWLPLAALLVVTVMLAAHQGYLQPWTLDDAYITFRYSRNLAEGHGAVFNPGERVEGYTSFLWMALLAGAHWVGLEIESMSKVLGAGLTLAWFGLLAASHRLVSGLDGRVSAGALLLAGTIGVTSRWAMSGMEVPLVVFWVVLGFGLHLRERGGDDAPWLPVASGLVAALAFLSRPDAGLLFGAMFLDRLLVKRTLDRALFTFVGVFLLVGGGWWAARTAWYGYPLPNTFYVKVGATTDQVQRGLRYLSNFMMLGWPLCALFCLGVWKGRLSERNPGLWALVLFVLMHLGYTLAVGGDVFWGWRFLAVAIPPMAVIGLLGALDAPWVRDRRRLAALAVVAITVFQIGYTQQSRLLNHRGWVARVGVKVGTWIHKHTPADALIAVNIAGSIPYFSERRAIDTLGLNDVHIAHREIPTMGRGRAGHEKGDGAYVFEKAPDIVMFGSSKGSKRPHFRGDRELYALDEFHKQYRFEVYRLDPERTLKLYVRRPEFGGQPISGVRPLQVVDDVRADLAVGGTDEPDVDDEAADGEGGS